MLRKGVRVICIDPDKDGVLQLGGKYLIAQYSGGFVRLQGTFGFFCQSRFKEIEPENVSVNYSFEHLSREEKIDLIRRIAESL